MKTPKNTELKMEFNPALEKFEPVPPLRKKTKRDRTSINLKNILILILFLAIASSLFIMGYLLLK